jgi:hypothetical protein
MGEKEQRVLLAWEPVACPRANLLKRKQAAAHEILADSCLGRACASEVVGSTVWQF